MSTLFRLCRTGMMTIAWLLVLPCLFILFGAVVPIIPWFRIYALGVVPNHSSWLFLWAIVALLIGLLANSLHKSPVAIAIVVTATVTLLATTGVMLHLLYVAQSNGARINVVRALELRELPDGARPDESRVYSRPQGEDLWLDIYHPAQTAPDGLSPVLIAVHGGGFFQGSRAFGAANQRWFADHGWTVISIDYRLARDDRPTWDLATRDVQCALAWTAANAATLHIDLDRVTLTGGSAGGSLAMAAGYLADAKRTDPECGPAIPHVAVVVAKAPLIDVIGSWYYPGELRDEQRSYLTRYIGGSPRDYPERYAAIDLRHFQFPSNPPTLLLGGASDPLLPAEAGADFMRKANAAGLEVHQILFPYSGHDFNTTYNSITNQAMRQIIAQFIVDHKVGPKLPGLTFTD
ncbi:MAG TPA: alpha/beta hydrolase [Sphingomonas sp.]